MNELVSFLASSLLKNQSFLSFFLVWQKLVTCKAHRR